jgi:hypothetical protein
MPAQNEGVARSSARRSPTVAAILSGLFPGLGQLYNRQRVKAVLFLVAAVVAGFGPLSPVDIDIDPNDPAAGLRKVLLASVPLLAIALWAVVDAYRSAQHPADASQ